jgi:hypothetical protein
MMAAGTAITRSRSFFCEENSQLRNVRNDDDYEKSPDFDQ